MGFLQKVEAGVFKAHRYNGKNKTEEPKAAEAPAKVSFSTLTETKKLIPYIEKQLGKTDPFDFANDTWYAFYHNVVPKLLFAVFLDMGVVPRKKRTEFIQNMTRRIRGVAK
jgi:hypothetical protein